MSIAIRVQLRGPTNTKPARYHVSDGRSTMYVKYQYEDDTRERLAAAEKFRMKYMPTAPKLHPIPAEFNGDSFYHFVPKLNPLAVVDAARTILKNNHICPDTRNSDRLDFNEIHVHNLLKMLEAALKMGATQDLT